MKVFMFFCTLFFPVKHYANTILDLQEGLTLAHISNNGEFNTLAIIEHKNGFVKAINLSELVGIKGDVISIYQYLGYQKMFDLIKKTDQKHYQLFSVNRLRSPAGEKKHHIALGFNYAEHADEVEEARKPFLFLKTLQPHRNNSIATDDMTLLDYEVEICARPLRAIKNPKQKKDMSFGFFLCGDFTDRAALMRHIDLDNMQSGKGFNAAKSREEYFPTGPYMVIPKNIEWFMNKVSFSLYRNSQLKQNSSTAKMIWPFDTIISEIFTAQRTHKPTQAVSSQYWLINDQMTTDMTMLTGTPEGVIMRPPSLGFKVLHGMAYIMKGAFMDMAPRQYVIERYIDSLVRDKVFLQPGEQLRLQAMFMGQINISIKEGSALE